MKKIDNRHPNQVTIKNATPEELAKIFMRTTYEYHKRFFNALSKLYEQESQRDKKRGYKQLSLLLSITSKTIHLIEQLMTKIWKLCKPHMIP